VVILSACTGQQNASTGGPIPTTSTATSPVTTAGQATTSVQATTGAPGDACVSATKATLDTALNADKQISSALVIDSKGLQNIKCAAPWAVAGFSNNIDGGSVVFKYQNGAWVPIDGGTDVCDDIPAAIAQRICA
jgi:hypothetical protein